MATVTLTPEVREKIGRTILETDDGRETGGCLLGYQRGDSIVVADAGGPDLFGQPFRRSPKRIEIPDEVGLELERVHEEIGSRCRWIGEFHSHPPRRERRFALAGRRQMLDQGGARPSRGDEDGWLRNCHLYASPWVAIIVSRAEMGVATGIGESAQPGLGHQLACRGVGWRR